MSEHEHEDQKHTPDGATEEEVLEYIGLVDSGSTEEDAWELVWPGVERLEVPADEAHTGAGTEGQDATPGDSTPDESNAVADNDEEFQYTFGHLEGEALETARRVFAAQKRKEMETNDSPGYSGG